MERLKMKRGLLRVVLAALMVTLITTTMITTAAGCLVCRDCGPNRHSRR
jgi:hypothetical protein